MIRKRYVDTAKLITDIEKFELTSAGEILIYCGDKWYDEVTVNLEGQEEKFEEVKSVIAYIAKNLYKIDLIAQRYDTLYGDGKFASSYEIGYICLNALNEISVRYYGMKVNTEFDVIFQYINDEFLLKSFGMRKNIPLDWDRESLRTMATSRLWNWKIKIH